MTMIMIRACTPNLTTLYPSSTLPSEITSPVLGDLSLPVDTYKNLFYTPPQFYLLPLGSTQQSYTHIHFIITIYTHNTILSVIPNLGSCTSPSVGRAGAFPHRETFARAAREQKRKEKGKTRAHVTAFITLCVC